MTVKYVLMKEYDDHNKIFISFGNEGVVAGYETTRDLAEAATWPSAEAAFSYRGDKDYVVVAVQCPERSI